MNSYEKSEKRFNFIDVLIILAVILIIAAVIFRAQIITIFNDGERRSECVIEFQCESVPKECISHIKEGIELSWLEKETSIGKLGKIEVSPAQKYVLKDNGSYEKFDDPLNYFIKGSITADVLYKDGCYIGGTAFLAPGMTITVHSENTQFEMTVLKITY